MSSCRKGQNEISGPQHIPRAQAEEAVERYKDYPKLLLVISSHCKHSAWPQGSCGSVH